MTGILLSKKFVAAYGRQLDEAAQRAGIKPDILHLPDDPQARLAPGDLDRIELTMLTRDVRFSEHFESFVDTLLAARNLKWANFHSTAIEQHAFVAPLLARRFPRWLDAQRRHA